VNEHSSYANVAAGDRQIAAEPTALKASPQWKYGRVVTIYVIDDEFDGWWNHATPPKADRFGSETRAPAIIVSSYVKKGFVHRM
jgi:phospholipase C